MITVRPATSDDAGLLLDWANDPVTRAAGFHPAPIDAETHGRWLGTRLAAAGDRLYIGLEDGRPVGQVRLDDLGGGRVEVGLSVAAAARRRGIGLALLEAGMSTGRAELAGPIDRFVARIRPDNTASRALFERAGFRATGTGTDLGVDHLIYERSAHLPRADRPHRIVAIVQARMGSTRLPGKVLLPLLGEPMLTRVMRRTARATRLDRVVLATTGDASDDPLARLADREDWPLVRGSIDDVLDRYVTAARAHDASVIVRITSDCPLIDPALIDETVAALEAGVCDYASNVSEPRTYPRGLDVEVIARDALMRAWAEDPDPAWREHVTPYIYRHPEAFRLCAVRAAEDRSGERWAVDTPEDYELVRRIYDHFGRDDFGWRDVLSLVDAHPEWRALNRATIQKVVPPAADPR